MDWNSHNKVLMDLGNQKGMPITVAFVNKKVCLKRKRSQKSSYKRGKKVWREQFQQNLMGWNSRNKCHSVSNGASAFIYVLVNGTKAYYTHKQLCIKKQIATN